MNYRVVFDPCLNSGTIYESEHETQAEAEAVLTAISNYTLMLHEAGLMVDYSFGCIQKRDSAGYWFEIDSDGSAVL